MGTLENRRKLTAVRGMGAALVGFAGWIVLYVVFGLIEPNIFTTNNMLNLLRSMAKYLLVGVGQGVILITGNIDLSIGSVVAMSAMISATMMSHGTAAIVAVCAAIVCCLAVGVINGLLVGKFKLPPFIATLGTMFCARGVAYLATATATPTPSSRVWARKPATLSRTSSITEKRLASTTPSGLRL